MAPVLKRWVARGVVERQNGYDEASRLCYRLRIGAFGPAGKHLRDDQQQHPIKRLPYSVAHTCYNHDFQRPVASNLIWQGHAFYKIIIWLMLFVSNRGTGGARQVNHVKSFEAGLAAPLAEVCPGIIKGFAELN